MKRRDFLRCGATAAGALVSLNRFPHHLYASDVRKTPQDLVTLGRTGIKVSRLAQGTGTNGVNHSSNQIRQLGDRGLADLLVKGVDNGLHFWDLADQYGSHPHAKLALQTVQRDKVVILSKTHASTEQEMRDDLDRFRKEMGVDRIDIVLLHCMLNANWAQEKAGAMTVLSEAKQKGIIRAHGCSCHSIEALRTAAKSPWVEVDLVRINPIGSHMDADPETVSGVIKEMRASGKALVGMKILGQGDLRHKQDEAIRYALGLNLLDAFTIGAESTQEQMDLIHRVASA